MGLDWIGLDWIGWDWIVREEVSVAKQVIIFIIIYIEGI